MCDFCPTALQDMCYANELNQSDILGWKETIKSKEGRSLTLLQYNVSERWETTYVSDVGQVVLASLVSSEPSSRLRERKTWILTRATFTKYKSIEKPSTNKQDLIQYEIIWTEVSTVSKACERSIRIHHDGMWRNVKSRQYVIYSETWSQTEQSLTQRTWKWIL